jgi:hypothetical protein
MTRADKLLIAGIVSAAILVTAAMFGRSAVFPNKAGAARAVISTRGKVDRVIDLSAGRGMRTFSVSGRGGQVMVEVAGKRIRVADALCMAQGWIEKPGASVVCVPGEIVIHIEGTAPLDAVTR